MTHSTATARCLACADGQLGRTAFVVVYINPVQPQDGFVIDGLRHQIDQRAVQH